MLKKIQFTFTVDPKDLALLLAHAGKLDVNLLADQPATQAQLALPRPKYRESILAFAQTKPKSFTKNEAETALDIHGRALYTALENLVREHKLKRLAKGVYARA